MTDPWNRTGLSNVTRRAKKVHALGHQHLTPRSGCVRGPERRGVVGDAVTHRAEILDVDPVHHLAQKDAGDVLDHDVVDPDSAPGRPGEVDAEMAIERCRRPLHVHPGAHAGSDDGTDLDDPAVGGQRHRRSGQRQPGHGRAARAPRPGTDPYVRQVSRQGLHPGTNAQVAARQDRRLAGPAQALRGLGLDDLKAATEVLVGRHEGCVGRAHVGRRARRAVLARPDAQPARERRRHQHQPVGNGLVHRNPFLLAGADGQAQGAKARHGLRRACASCR